jgi:hypothetical protein
MYLYNHQCREKLAKTLPHLPEWVVGGMYLVRLLLRRRGGCVLGKWGGEEGEIVGGGREKEWDGEGEKGRWVV